MNLRQLECFAAIVEHMSFKKAAEELYISSSAVTQHIKNLEHELDCSLLHRSAQSIRLTEAGKTFYGGIAKVLEDLRNTVTETKKISNALYPKLVIGYIGVPADQILHQAIKSFYAVYPNLDVQLYPCDAGEISYLLNLETIDIAITTKNYISGSQDLIFKKLFSYKYDFVIHFTHPLAKNRELKASDLQSIPLILLKPSHNTNLFNEYCQKHLTGFDIHYVDTISDLLIKVRALEGAAILPEYISLTRPDSVIAPLASPLTDDFGIAYHAQNRNPYINHLQNCLLELDYSNFKISNISAKSLL